MRGLIILVLVLLCRTLSAQFEYAEKPQNIGQAIGEGAVRAYSDLEERVKTLEQLVPPYQPSWTWPGHDGPEPFEKLRAHMAGESIHPARSVAKWSRAELAFRHDCDHVEELLAAGKGLPLLKDQRLRDWVRAKNPARSPQRKWRVSRIVMHTQPNCPPCERWKQANLSTVLADGVEFVEAPPDYRRTPAFDVTYCNGDYCITKNFGNTSYASMRKQFDDDDFVPAPAGD